MAYPRGLVDQRTLATTSETELVQARTSNHFKQGLAAYLYSASVGGTMSLYYTDQNGNDRLLSTAAVTSADLTVISVDFPVPFAKLKFTPASGTSSVVTSEVIGK